MSWKPEPCAHDNQGLAGGCESCFEQAQTLTAVAHTRGGIERAVSIVEGGAVEAFRQGNDAWAKCLRGLRDALQEEADKEGEKQGALLQEQGLLDNKAS